MKSQDKICVYLPQKTDARLRDPLGSPGILEPADAKKVVEKVREAFPSADISEGVDFKEFSIVGSEVFWNDKPLRPNAYVWHSHLDLSPDSFHLHALKHLARSVPVIKNPFAEAIGLDKFASHSALRAAGVKVADFCLVSSRNADFAGRLLRKWGKMVIKPRLGNFGVGVMLVDSESTLRDLFGILKEETGKAEVTLFAERFYPHDMKEWISTTMFGHKVIYGYRKKAGKFVDGWKVFDDMKVSGDPSTVDYVDPPAEVKREAEKASRAIGADIIGFDFIKTKEGYVIVDENTKPGFYGHCFRKSGTPIEEAFAGLLASRLKPGISSQS